MMELFLGSWTYRSLLNDPDLGTDFDALEFGRASLAIVETGPGEIGGTIGGPGWSLALHGGVGFGSPMQARFQGSGTVDGAPWVYDYLAWRVPVWPGSSDGQQIPALVGSVTRTVAHPSGDGGTAPAGVVASFYAVRQPG